MLDDNGAAYSGIDHYNCWSDHATSTDVVHRRSLTNKPTLITETPARSQPKGRSSPTSIDEKATARTASVKPQMVTRSKRWVNSDQLIGGCRGFSYTVDAGLERLLTDDGARMTLGESDAVKLTSGED